MAVTSPSLYIVPPLIAAAAVLAGIWLKAYLDHINERRVIAAVAFAQLEDLVAQLKIAKQLLEYVTKYMDKERIKELLVNAEARKKGEDEFRPHAERLRKELELRREFSKEVAVKFILQTSPTLVGRLGPLLAYFVTALYTQITSALINFVATFATLDLESILRALEGLDGLSAQFKTIEENWAFLRPLLLRATGLRATSVQLHRSKN